MDNEQGQNKPLFDADFGARIAAMVEDQVARSLEGLDIETMVQAEIEKAMAKIEHKVDKAKRHAHEHALHAQERAEHAQERAQRAADRASRHADREAHGINISVDVEHGRGASPKVSEEEQLAILQMLQNGTITPEQADMLLNALET